jgi:chromosome segregation ATPase
MTKKRSQSSGDSNSAIVDDPSSGRMPELFPNLARFLEEIQQAEEEFDRLSAENQALREQLQDQDRDLDEAQEKIQALKAEVGSLEQELDKQKQTSTEKQERLEALEAQCRSLEQRIEQTEAEVASSRTDALVSLFKDMADVQYNHVLRKLLAFEDEEPELLHHLASYFRDNLKLTLEGEVHAQIMLTEENLDDYEVEERVVLPCPARVIGRGISFDGRPILRTQVEPLEGTEDNGD